jgi:hypothetical protein
MANISQEVCRRNSPIVLRASRRLSTRGDLAEICGGIHERRPCSVSLFHVESGISCRKDDFQFWGTARLALQKRLEAKCVY